MSRTVRRKRKTEKKVRDGENQYAAASCRHHGGCGYCEGNRLHSTHKREPLPDGEEGEA